MSRIAKAPIAIPAGVEVTLTAEKISVKGKGGQLELDVHSSVEIKEEDNTLSFGPRSAEKQANALAGTFRSLVKNMVVGVTAGFDKKLVLQGLRFHAKASGKTLNLQLGFSHHSNSQLPEGVSAETPRTSEVVIKGIDKQVAGPVAAAIRCYRPPEPYKRQSVHHSDENVRRKEAKKK